MKNSEPLVKGEAGYRATLLDKRRIIRADFGFRAGAFASAGNLTEDDQAQAYHDECVSLSLNSLEYAQLRQIEDALSRLDSGGYGRCLSCDAPIPEKRLSALPWAPYCVKCQEKLGTPPAPEE